MNRIVQERLAKEKSKGSAGNGADDLEKRAAELDMRERKLNAVEKLRENGLPDYLVEALNIETEETFQKSLDIINKMKSENGDSCGFGSVVIDKCNPIGVVKNGGNKTDSLKAVFGL